jgi:hypothetical protein
MCRSKAEGGRRCSGRYRASAARAAGLAAIAARPGITREPLYGGQTSVTELATAPDGTRGEELADLLAEAVGAPALASTATARTLCGWSTSTGRQLVPLT